MDEVLQLITREACALMEARMASLLMLDPSGQWLDLRASSGAGPSYLAKPRLSVDESFMGIVVRRKKPMQLENVQSSTLYQIVAVARREGLVSLLSAPLVFSGQTIGTLNVYTGQPRSFSNEEVHILTALTELSAIAIAKARLYERVVDVEEQLRQNEKLSALGLLAAEVAHEIRNPLTVMKMLYHSLRLDFSPGDPRVRDDAILRENMDHLNKIVEQILDFARGTEPNPGPVNLNQLLDDLALLVRHKLRNQKIQFVRRLAPDLPQIMADPTQLAQAFLNLTLNAVEAMPKGGTLTISTRAVTLPRGRPPAHPRSDRIPRHRPGDAPGTTPPPLLLLVEHDQTEGHRIGIGHCQPGSRDPSWKSPHSFPARPWHRLHRLLAGLISLKTRLQNVCLAGMNRTIFALALLLAAARDGAARQDAAAFATREPARRGSAYRLVTPVNQIVDPAGRQLDLPGLRPQALALSPDGRLLVTSGKTRDLLVIDPVAGQVLQTVPLPPDNASISSRGAVSPRILSREKDDQLSFNGLIFSPDGSRIYLSDVAGSVKVFGVDASHRVQALYSIPLPPANAPEREAEIPAGLALSADGRRLYVALNLGNGLAELDLANGKLLRRWDTGVAPYGVAVAGRKIYVSNWGGRRPIRPASPAPPVKARASAWMRRATSPAKAPLL